MSEPEDPFTGTWKFNAQRSKLSDPSPQSWVQRIIVARDEVHVRENTVRPDGSKTALELRAKFDGMDYPVSGSPVADVIAYKRINGNSIRGTGKKNGDISLRETVSVAPDGRTLTLSYTTYKSAQEIASGVAVFEKDAV